MDLTCERSGVFSYRSPWDFRSHFGSKDGEPRLTGLATKQWLTRFEVPEDELIRYKAKLLLEPKLSKETTLPDAL